MHEIEIGRIGTFTDGKGITKAFTEEFLEEVSSSYNPKNFRAPLIITHDTKGVPDDKLADNKELSFGAPSIVKVVGDRLKACFEKISPRIKKLYQDGGLLSVSPSFYPPNHKSNPTPGKWSLRHIAGLGVTPPAIKGLEAPSFSETGYDPEEDCLNFSFEIAELKETDGLLTFSMAGSRIQSILSKMRDYLIETGGVESANKIISPQELENIVLGDRLYDSRLNRLEEKLNNILFPHQDKAQPTYYQEPSTMTTSNMTTAEVLTELAEQASLDFSDIAKMSGLKEKTISSILNGEKEPTGFQLGAIADAMELELSEIIGLKDSKKKKEKPLEPEEEEIELSETPALKKIAELEFALEEANRERQKDRRKHELEIQRNSQLLEQQKEARKRDRITSFCESLVEDGKVLASQAGDRVLDFGEGESSELDLVGFMVSLDDEQLAFAENFFQDLSSQISFEEFAKDSDDPDSKVTSFNVAPGANVTAESQLEYQEVLSYMEENGLDIDNDEHFDKACKVILG